MLSKKNQGVFASIGDRQTPLSIPRRVWLLLLYPYLLFRRSLHVYTPSGKNMATDEIPSPTTSTKYDAIMQDANNDTRRTPQIISTKNQDEEEEHLPKNRFELELEFVQCLASPAYLHHLATTGVLGDSSFLKFLEYLRYWKQPEYVRFLQYPHCLHFLELLLENATFRRELANVSFRNFVHEQQFYAWQFRATNLYGQGLSCPESTAHAIAISAEPSIEEQQKLK